MANATLQTLFSNATKSQLWLALFISEFSEWRSNASNDERSSYDLDALRVFVSCSEILSQSGTLTHAALPLLYDVATARIDSLDAAAAIPAVKLALSLATHHELDNDRRRAHNVLAALQLSVGDPYAALHNALSAASIARELNSSETLVNALLNATLALTHMGLFREAIEIAMTAESSYCMDPTCISDLALLLGNAAHAASTTGEHTVALMFAKRALDVLPGASGVRALARVNIYLTQLKSAIELRQHSTIESAISAIRDLASNWPSHRMDLCHRLAEALHVGFGTQAYSFVLAELAIVREHARGHHDLFLEASHQLIQLSLSLGDDAGVVRHVNHLVETVGATQAANVESKIGAIKSLLGEQQSPFLRELSTFRRVELPTNEVREMVQRLAVASELAEDVSGKSVFRVGRLAYLLSCELGYGVDEATVLEHAARLHDIGKLTLPTALIAKPHRLSEPEYDALHAHAAAGAHLLRQLGHPFFEYAASIALSHHETWEGTGYPNQIAGEEIPEAARMVALCETYDSLTHSRSYRDRITHAEAVAFISSCSGTHFDPTMTPIFIKLVERLYQRYADEIDAFLQSTADRLQTQDFLFYNSPMHQSLSHLITSDVIDASVACELSTL